MVMGDKIEYNGSLWEIISVDWRRGVTTLSSPNHGVKVISFNEYYHQLYSGNENKPWDQFCFHEWKIYDSGWTRYEYCSKCNEEKK